MSRTVIQIHVESTGNIIVDFYDRRLGTIIDATLPFVRLATRIRNSTFTTNKEDGYCQVFMPKTASMDKCQQFALALSVSIRAFVQIAGWGTIVEYQR